LAITPRHHFSNIGFVLFSWISTLLVLGAAAILIFFLLYHGLQTLSLDLFFGATPWWQAVTGNRPVFNGIWPAMAGTFFLVLLSAGMAIPVGIASGIYLTEYASQRAHAFSTFAVDLLAGIPSIVMGLFGFSMIIVLRRTFFPDSKTCIFLAAVCIALLILPYMVRTTMNALSGIPENIRLIGPGLGLTQWQTIRHILLPASSKGILSGIILSVGRAAEDTAVILLTGVVAQASIPKSLWSKFEALPFRIFYLAAEHRSAEQLNQAFGAALILLMITGTIFAATFGLQKLFEKQWAEK
jgi:phosphate transport system permease protein